MAVIPGILASSITGHLVTSNFFKIATVTASGGETSLSFTSIPSTYKSLQIRGIARDTQANTYARGLDMYFNADSGGSSYAVHALIANGTNTFIFNNSASNYQITGTPNAGMMDSSAGANIFAANIIDVIDYSSTSKYKTVKMFTGGDNNLGTNTGRISISSALWMSTSAITGITLNSNEGGAFTAGTTFTLYGIS